VKWLLALLPALLPALIPSLLAGAHPPFTLPDVLSAAFPSELVAAPDGLKVAWVSNAKGVRNLMLAEAPGYLARKLTTYSKDDGQELTELHFTSDSAAIVYVRGGEANGRGEIPNPAQDPAGATQDVWIVALDGAPPRKIGEGNSPAPSPKGDRVAFVRHGQLWWAQFHGAAAPAQPFHARGAVAKPVWSPDAARIAFTSGRGDHALIGVFDVAANTLQYLDPGTDQDSEPEWSPDGRKLAVLRVPSNGLRTPREPHRTGEPWSIRLVDIATGAGREIWRASPGPGSVFRGVTARNQLQWMTGDRILFPWEADGWTHLYTVSADGGKAVLLTPGAFEVEDVAVRAGGREVLYSSNQNDIDRRHLWKVAVSGGAPVPVTPVPAQGIECVPVPVGADAVVFLQADARTPIHPAIRAGASQHDLDPSAIPPEFPLARMVAPQPVTFTAADGLEIHGQLFLPPGKAANGRAPAMVFFHGGSRRQMLLGWHYMYYYANAYAMNQYLANLGYVVLSVNYRSGTGYGMEFREAVNYGANGGAEYNDVQGVGIYLRSRPDVDAARIGTWGGSYGGYLVAMALARSSDLYKAGVDFHGVHNWATELGVPVTEPDYKIAFESSPMAFLKTWRSPVLLIQGDDDRSVQFNQTVMLADALRRQGVEMEELVLPDEGHDFLLYKNWIKAYEATVDFLGRHLK
jgi:dipeptidyl aminopeptidase/acylaminoacyl peptidase